jgi:hypothetical protein
MSTCVLPYNLFLPRDLDILRLSNLIVSDFVVLSVAELFVVMQCEILVWVFVVIKVDGW